MPKVKSIPVPTLSKAAERRFWGNVDRVEGGCCTWTGSTSAATTRLENRRLASGGWILRRPMADSVSRRFEVRSIPTLVLLDHGKVVDKQIGALPAHQLRSWLESKLPTGA